MFKHEWVAWEGFKSLTTLGRVQDKMLYKKYKMLEFWNAGQGRFPNSEILKIYWIFFQCGIWGYPRCLMDKMKYPRLIYQRLCLPLLPLLPQQKTYSHILTSLYVNILNWISTSYNSVNKTGCSQHTLNITELELLSSFTLATNPQTAAAITEYLLFVCTKPHYVQYFPC